MSKKYFGKTCPYCKTPLLETDAVAVCGTCDMPHHLSCWQDNQGCTTFGCTGTIREIIGSNAGAAAAPVTEPQPVQAAPVRVGQTEKPIETLYESRETVFMADVPVALENTALIIDRRKDQLFARCTFRSMTDQPIKAVMVEISCRDVWGKPLGEPVEVQYLDLKTKRGSAFGQTKPVELSDQNTREISVLIKKILFKDGSVITGGDSVSTMGAPVLLSQHLGSDDLAAEYARETTPKARFVPEMTDTYWRCTCGALNVGGDEVCPDCRSAKEALLAALNPGQLRTNMVSFQTAKRAKEEKERAERAERIRIAEEQVRLEQARKEQEMQEAERVKKEQDRIKRKKFILIGSAALGVVLILVFLIWGIPYVRYQSACSALERGEYDAAYETFVDLDDFMESSVMAKEAMYQKGKVALEEDRFDDAITIFRDLGKYSDSKALLAQAEEEKELAEKEARYQEGLKALNEKQYDAAIEIFSGLGDYSDSADKLEQAQRFKENAAKEARYQEGIAALDNGKYDEAIAIFTELGDYVESKAKLAEAKAKKEEQIKQARYEEGITALNNKQYDTAIAIFTELGDFSDSKAKLAEAENGAKEVRYQEGLKALNNKQYDKAITIFTELGSYSDSKAKLTEAQNKKKEARYQEGLKALNNKQYDQAIKIFKELGSYSDSKAKLAEAQEKYNQARYQEGVTALNNKKYDQAVKIFSELGSYSDSKTKLTEAKYGQACEYHANKDYKKAVTLFGEISSYKDSATKQTESMYAYVLAHKDKNDKTTVEYLKKLKKQDYKDSAKIYDDLYKWKVTGVINTDEDDTSTHESSVSQYCPYLQGWFKLSGGAPGETVNLTHTTIYPDGEVRPSSWHWYDVEAGDGFGCEWEDGLYDAGGATGTLTLKIYNLDTGELLFTISTKVR